MPSANRLCSKICNRISRKMDQQRASQEPGASHKNDERIKYRPDQIVVYFLFTKKA